jgi:hypothetical protein
LEKAGGNWTYGALTDSAFKVYPGSHLDAISTKELGVSNAESVQIKVVFVDGKGVVSEASIQKGKWTKMSLIQSPHLG